jgi:hypothetical protein
MEVKVIMKKQPVKGNFPRLIESSKKAAVTNRATSILWCQDEH